MFFLQLRNENSSCPVSVNMMTPDARHKARHVSRTTADGGLGDIERPPKPVAAAAAATTTTPPRLLRAAVYGAAG